MYSVWVSWHDMSCIFLDAEVPCHVTFFSQALYRWHGTYAFFCFFHFADDMGVCVFWVCPTTPMSSASTIIHGFSQWRLIYGGFLSHEGVSKSSSRHGWPWLCIETYGALGIPPIKNLKKPAWCDNEEQSIWKYCNNISCIWVTNDNSELNMSENHISRLGDHDMIHLAIMS